MALVPEGAGVLDTVQKRKGRTVIPCNASVFLPEQMVQFFRNRKGTLIKLRDARIIEVKEKARTLEFDCELDGIKSGDLIVLSNFPPPAYPWQNLERSPSPLPQLPQK